MTAGRSGADPLIGQMIGSYRIVEPIGAGGMGTVYAAEQPAIGARVAVKVLSHSDARDPKANQRLFAEARAVNLIRHEHIVNILDLTTLADGRPCVVMEYLDGKPLSVLLAERGALPLASFAVLIRQVLAGLSAAHEQGIVHRDLKPANIFVSPEGNAKLLDFGIAKFLGPEALAAQLTAAGFVLGTVPYMSPEQATGEPVDALTDVFAAGAVLYEGAIGQRPFSGRNVPVLCEEHAQGPQRPSQLRPSIPAAYEAVILRALAAERRERFPSAAEMAKALEAAAAGLPEAERAPLIPPPPGGAVETRNLRAGSKPVPAPAASPRKSGRALTIALVVFLVVIGAAGGLIFYVLDSGGRSESVSRRDRAPGPTPTQPNRPETPADPPLPPVIDAGSPDADVDSEDVGAFQLDAPPAELDPVRAIDIVTARVKVRFPDARLTSVSFTGLSEDGRVHFDAAGSGVTYQFIASWETPQSCRSLTVHIAKGPAKVEDDEASCEDKAIESPRCPGRELAWRAKQRIAGAAVPMLLFLYPDQGQWAVHNPQAASLRFPDDCTPPGTDLLE